MKHNMKTIAMAIGALLSTSAVAQADGIPSAIPPQSGCSAGSTEDRFRGGERSLRAKLEIAGKL